MPTSLRTLPNLRGLRVLEALWQTGSVTAAADLLNVSYPAISHQIRLLEESTDAQLFRREGRRTVLTEAGKSLARVTHESFVAIGHELDLLTLRETAPINLAAGPFFASGWLMPRVVRYLGHNPDVRIHMNVIQNDTPVVQNPDILILFRLTGDLPDGAVPLAGGRAIPVASPEFLAHTPIASEQDIARATRYSDEDMRMWTLWFQAAGIDAPQPDPIRLHVGGSGMMRDAALCGQGISLCREALIQPELKSGRLIALSDVSIDDEAVYYLTQNTPESGKPGLQDFVAFLIDEARRPGPD